MTKATRSMRSMMSARLGALFMAVSQAEAPAPVSNMIDLSDQGRLQVTFTLTERSALMAIRDTAVVSFSGRVVQGAMLHAFRVEVVDAAGQPVQDRTSWGITVFGARQGVGNSRVRALVRLTGYCREITLPKPLGFRLVANDSLLIVATFHETDSQAQLFIRLTIEYDLVTGPLSRLAVFPLDVTTPSSVKIVGASNTPTQSWEWKADMSGRLLAIAGLPLHGVAQLVLQDVETGAVLWNAAVAGQQPVLVHGGQVVRLGVPVQEGRGYRLTATYRATHVRVAADGALAVAMVLPSRS
jgi:hypothetical protein